jgi:type II secretory pathway predicted ATPase ExeA
MYENFFGLTERPFQLTPNPRYLFLNPSHREALATLRDGLSAPRGVTLLLGEAGTGKTTLLMAALRLERRPTHRFVLVSNPTLKRDEFYEYLSGSFRLPGAGGSKARFLLEFQNDVAEHAGKDGITAIVIDEAQSLSHELLEEVRLLANLETETTKLVNVVLVGQQELASRLNQPELRQLKQRVGLRCALQPLDLRETACYIAARLRTAGADASEVFTRDAVLAVYEASRGIPRTIGVICDNALIGGYAAQVKPVTRAIVEDVCRDFDLVVGDEPAGPRRAAAPPLRGPLDVTRGGPEPAERVDADDDAVAAPPPRVGYRGRRIFPD